VRARRLLPIGIAVLLAGAGLLALALDDGARSPSRHAAGSVRFAREGTARAVPRDGAGAVPPPPFRTECLLSGRVLEGEGDRPVAGARVTLAPLAAPKEIRRGGPVVECQGVLRDDPVEPATETHTDADGHFTLGAPATGPVLLTAGRDAEPPVRLLVADAARCGEPVLRLFRCAQLEVRVVDRESGLPVPDATVRLYDLGDKAPPCLVRRTDAQGRAVLAVPRPASGWKNDVYVRVDAAGHATSMLEVFYPERGLEVRLWRGWSLEGVAVSTSGEPIPDLPLSVELRCHETWHSLEIVRRTDDNGRFSFDGLDARSYHVHVVDPRYALPQTEAFAGRPAFTLVVSRAASIGGVVTDEQGRPVARVVLKVPDNPPYGGAFAATGADGRFSIAGLLPGAWILVVQRTRLCGYGDGVPTPRRLLPEPIRLDLAEGARLTALDVRVETRPFSWAVVRLRDACGEPLSGSVCSVSDPPGVCQYAGSTGEDGVARTAVEVPPGTHVVVESQASQYEHRLRASAACVTTSDPDAPFTDACFPEPVVVPVVVRGPQGAALPDDLDVELDLHGDGYEVPLTHVDNRYPLRHQWCFHLQPGEEFRLVATPPSPWYAWRTIYTGIAGARTGPVHIDLTPAGRVVGRVVDAKGRPFEGARARVLPDSRGLGGTTDESGAFEITNLPPGEWRLGLAPGDGPPESFLSVRCEANATLDLGTLVLPRPVPHAGRVLDEEGYRVEGCRLSLVVPACGDRHLPAWIHELEEVPDGDGRFAVDLAPGGTARLLVSAPGHAGVLLAPADFGREVVLRSAARLQVNLPGRRPTRAEVWCAAVGPGGTDYLWASPCRLAGEGLLLDDLPAGRLRVLVGPCGTDDPLELEADLEAGKTTVLTVPR